MDYRRRRLWSRSGFLFRRGLWRRLGSLACLRLRFDRGFLGLGCLSFRSRFHLDANLFLGSRFLRLLFLHWHLYLPFRIPGTHVPQELQLRFLAAVKIRYAGPIQGGTANCLDYPDILAGRNSLTPLPANPWGLEGGFAVVYAQFGAADVDISACFLRRRQC